jgi:hypothetical protein
MNGGGPKPAHVSSLVAPRKGGEGPGRVGGQSSQQQHQQQQHHRIPRKHVEARKALPIYKQRAEIVEVREYYHPSPFM